MSRGDIAIVGLAGIFPGADDVGTFWRNIVNGVDAIAERPPERWPGADHLPRLQSITKRGGFVSAPFYLDPMRFKNVPNIVRHGEAEQFLLLEMVADALEDAGVSLEAPVLKRTDLIVGFGSYGRKIALDILIRADMVEHLVAFLEGGGVDLGPHRAALEAALPEMESDVMATALPNFVASRAANRLDLGGAAYAVDGACASALLALEHGVARLRDERADLALVGGINFSHLPGIWYFFDRIHALSSCGTMRPFDRRADGILLGEGGGVMALKRLEDARRDGDRVYALVKGVGSSSDGRATGILAPSTEGQIRALENAYRDAAVEPATVGFVEAHGTGTIAGDAAELETLARIFGPPRGACGTRALGAVKSMIGHLLPGAGMASLIKAALSLTHKVLPPTLHCQEPHEALRETDFYLDDQVRPWVRRGKGEVRRAGVNAFGFGGINAHAVLEEVRPDAGERRPLRARPVRPNVERPTELLLFAATDSAHLARRLRAVATFVEDDRAGLRLVDLAAALAGETDQGGACRLGLVQQGLEGLADRLRRTAAALEAGTLEPGEGSELFYGLPSEEPRPGLAAVFPGMGFPGLVGDLPQHQLQLALHFPEALEVLDAFEERDQHPEDPVPLSLLLSPPSSLPDSMGTALGARLVPLSTNDIDDLKARRQQPSRRNLAALGVLVSSWISWEILRRLRVEPDMLCGLSMGEMTALGAVGMGGSLEESLPLVWKLLDPEISLESEGCLAVVGAAEEQIAPCLERFDRVHFSIFASPKITILGGEQSQVESCCTCLQAEGYMSQLLPFMPVHTPEMRPIQKQLGRFSNRPDRGKFQPPRIPVYSTTLEAPMPENRRKMLAAALSNMTQPVRFWQTVQRMQRDGAGIFLQVGAGNLASNIRSFFPDDEVLCLATDLEQRHPLTQLQRICGSLFAAGIPFAADSLTAGSEPIALDLAAPRPAPSQSATTVPLDFYHTAVPLPSAGTEPAAPPPPESTPPVESRPAMPFLGRVIEHQPGHLLRMQRQLQLDKDVFLQHHTLVRADVRPVKSCLPLMPLTMSVEMAAEVAACLVPGQGLIGVEKAVAARWIDLVDRSDRQVEVHAERRADEGDSARVSSTILADGNTVFSGDFFFGHNYRQTLSLSFAPPTGVRPFPLSAAEVYAQRYLFHGPLFQCIGAVRARGDRCIQAELVVGAPGSLFAGMAPPQLLLDPVILDGAGQLVSLMGFDRNWFVLPTGFQRLELYGPTPPPGTKVPAYVEFTEIDEERLTISVNFEVQDGAGHVWFRVEGWRDRMFLASDTTFAALRLPRRHALAPPLRVEGMGEPAVAYFDRSQIQTMRREWVARIYLHGDEWQAFMELDNHAVRQRQWLMGRIAAKDAVRQWLGARAADCHPGEICLGNDPQGRPVVESLPGGLPLPCISLAHTDARAVAVAGAGEGPQGIDIEPQGAAGQLDLNAFATAAEQQRLAALAGRGDWPTRLWCAKEAAAKALGTGLEGRPLHWVAESLDDDGMVRIAPPGDRGALEVFTWEEEGFVGALVVRAH